MRLFCAFLLLLLLCPFALAQDPLPLTADQLELRLADAATQAQRTLCATLWHQANDLERQLKKLQSEHADLKHELALLKESKEAMLHAAPKP